MLTRNHLLARRGGARRAVARRGGPNAQAPIKLGELKQLQGLFRPSSNLQEGLGAGRRGGPMRRAAWLGPQRSRVISRDDNGNPGDAVRVAEELLSREGRRVSLIGHLPRPIVGPGGRRLRQAAQRYCSSPPEPLTEQDRLGDAGKRLHHSALLRTSNLHADGHAHSPMRSKLNKKRWGDRLPIPQLRVTARTATGGLSRGLSVGKAAPAAEFVAEQADRRLARSTPVRWPRRWPTPSPDAIFSSLFRGPDLAKFVREGPRQRGIFKGQSRCFNLLAGRARSISIPPEGGDAGGAGMFTGYPWSEIKTPGGTQVPQRLSGESTRTIRGLGSVVGYSTIMSGGSRPSRKGGLARTRTSLIGRGEAGSRS